jgi:hypothetical protein
MSDTDADVEGPDGPDDELDTERANAAATRKDNINP